MPAIQVRNLPEPIYQKLVAEAAMERRSLAQQIIVILEKGLFPLSEGRSRRNQILEEVRQTSPVKNFEKLSDPVEMIREDRER